MDRKLNRNLVVGIARNARYIPTILSTIKNWPTYFLYYLGIKKGGAAYFFRNGITLRDREGTASGTIAVVFIRKQYGSVAGKSTIVEIGANVGTFAIYAAAADPRVKLYSYEPIPENYKVLIENIAANGFQERVKAFNLGVAGTSGKRDFYLASSPEHSFIPAGGSSRSVTVNCLSLRDVLDSNNLTKVDLLKINAEGAEYEILYSAPKECFDRIDEIRMEYHGHHEEKHDLAHLKSFLEQFGYVTTHLYQHFSDEGFIWLKKRQ
jgi:FkbM family methyltransferase